MSETVCHAIVLADVDPLRRVQIATTFERWYGKQFPVITATDARDAEQVLQGLVAKETQVVLVAAVAPDQPDVPDTLATSERIEGSSAAGCLWLVPDGEGVAEPRQDGTVRLPFTSDRLSRLDIQQLDAIRQVDTAIYSWWNQAQEEERGSLVSVTITAHYRSKRAFEIRMFLAGSGVVFSWKEASASDPIVVNVGGLSLSNPSLAKLAVACNLVDSPTIDWFDVVVVGGGPAGLSAAVYAGIEGWKVLVIEADVPGGQISSSPSMDNYLGFPEGISGYQFARKALAQVRKYEAAWESAHKATQLILGDDKNPHTVVVSEVNGTSLTDGADKKYKAGAVVIASGRTWKMFTDKDVEGIEQVTGRGVYYIVLPGDVSYTKDANVVIVGGSDAAGEAALALGDQPKVITMVVRGKFEITINDIKKYITDRIKAKKISVLEDSVVTKCVADSNNELTSVVVSNSKTGAVNEISTTWMYCLIGSRPNSDWIKNAKIALSTTGAVLTGYNAPSTQSSVPGIYAIGDVQYGAVPRVGSAVGKGAVVITELSDYRAQHPTLFPSGRQSVGYFGVEERV